MIAPFDTYETDHHEFTFSEKTRMPLSDKIIKFIFETLKDKIPRKRGGLSIFQENFEDFFDKIQVVWTGLDFFVEFEDLPKKTYSRELAWTRDNFLYVPKEVGTEHISNELASKLNTYDPEKEAVFLITNASTKDGSKNNLWVKLMKYED
jgi:hypothetical protein